MSSDHSRWQPAEWSNDSKMGYLMMEVKSVWRYAVQCSCEWARRCRFAEPLPTGLVLTFCSLAHSSLVCSSPHDVDDTDTKTTFWRATFLSYMRHATPPHSSAAAASASAALPATPAAAHSKPPLSFSLQEAQKAMMRVSRGITARTLCSRQSGTTAELSSLWFVLCREQKGTTPAALELALVSQINACYARK
jgi:hypothetical protein